MAQRHALPWKGLQRKHFCFRIAFSSPVENETKPVLGPLAKGDGDEFIPSPLERVAKWSKVVLFEEVKAAALDHSATKVGRVKGHVDSPVNLGLYPPSPPLGLPEDRNLKKRCLLEPPAILWSLQEPSLW